MPSALTSRDGATMRTMLPRAESVPCELCGRPCWLDDDEWRPVHPCCVIEIERWGGTSCTACLLADSERRRWALRQLDRL
jgi:hypothetical protein